LPLCSLARLITEVIVQVVQPSYFHLKPSNMGELPPYGSHLVGRRDCRAVRKIRAEIDAGGTFKLNHYHSSS